MSEWSVIEWEARHAAVEARLRHNDSYGFYEEYDEVPLRLRTMRGKIMAQLGVPRGIAEALMAAFGDVDTAIQQGRASRDPATRVMLNGKIQYKLISTEDPCQFCHMAENATDTYIEQRGHNHGRYRKICILCAERSRDMAFRAYI